MAGGIALPWPAFQIRAKPDSVGLDGLPSWFWLEGYDGRPIAATQHLHLDGRPSPQPGCPAGPPADEDVGVRAVPVAYMWRFGDDDRSLATTSLGVPYPLQVGAITHQYQVTSRGSGHPDGFPVQAIARFRVQFRAGEGDWQTLAETSREATLRYRVQQAYPVIVGP